MITDYDEDAHFCLKCHETIIGLENYVSHRKTGCSKTINVVEIPKSPLPSQLLPPDESFTLKADDFFSSLELQSSSKKAPVPSTSGKTFSGILTRSKTSAVIQACNSSKDNPTELQQSKSGKNAWIGGHQLKELGTGDNQTKLIKAVDNLSRNACLKKVDIPPDIGVYDSDDDSDETDFDDDEYEDDEDAPPRSFTGGKWKPSSPISEWNEPPPNFTGGKWKPKSQRIQLLPPANHTKGKWKPDSPLLKDGYDAIPSPSFTGSKWTAAKARNEYGDVPPPSHTKGKWKPGKEKALRSENEDSNETFPPPSHTKGKWKPLDKKVIETNKQKQPVIKNEIEKRKISEESPPFRKSNGGVQYWCRPCNRRLASKIVYERHLKSELHLKRTVHESEFDDSSDLNTNLDKETKKTIRKPVEYWSHTTAEDNKDTMKNTTQTTKRIRRKIYEKCEVCRSRVTSQMMGKHLISHYHCRKGDITLPEAKKMVLDNIHNIVLQSPYQCGTCKFYCNTQSYFLQHWNSEGHKINISKQYGYIWCIFCKFSAADNNSMFTHLTSTEHNEVISAINRSVPIIIKKISPIKCKTCSQSFLLNFQLRKHCEKHKHEPNRTSTDEYQNKQKCSLCENIFKSKVALQRHISSAHKSKLFFCSSCSVQFKTQEEINAHRKTVEHRYSVDSKSKTKQKAYKKCEYCEELFENILFLKKHLKEKHPEHTHNCPHCGEKFIVPQDVTVHVRSKSCTFFKMPKKNQCDKCLYGTDTISELLFHKSLHNEPLIVTGNAKQPQKHYKCPLCDRHYPKVSLRFHIQNHTNEKAYSCNLCDAKFARKNNWKFHIKNHGKDRKKTSAKEPTERSYLCATCGTSFSKNSTLQKHMLTHGGKKFKCTEPNCIHLARTSAELKIHIKTHSSEKNYQCDRCDYRGKTKQQLRRHMTVHEETKKFKCPHCSFTTRLGFHLRRHERVHTGSKPYACPHCEYRSNNLENLRKHVLSTNKHPGQCIYECKFCEEGQFQSNFAKDFKVHLISEHGDVFESGTEAAGYISGIYDGMAEDAPPPPPPLPPSPLKETDIENVQLEETTDELMKPEGNYENKELFPMYIVAKDEVVCVDKDTWSMVASFDVEESGALVSFNEEGETFFQEHFQ